MLLDFFPSKLKISGHRGKNRHNALYGVERERERERERQRQRQRQRQRERERHTERESAEGKLIQKLVKSQRSSQSRQHPVLANVLQGGGVDDHYVVMQ